MPGRVLHDPEALGPKDLVERSGELGVSIPEQDVPFLQLLRDRQVPGLLSDQAESRGLVAEFIPIAGTHIAGVIPLVVVLAENGPYAAIIVVIEILVYQQVKNHYLNPRIRRRHSS